MDEVDGAVARGARGGPARRGQGGLQGVHGADGLGRPADTQESKTPERSVRFHTFIRCTSGSRVGRWVASNLACDGTSSEVEIAVENGLITEVKYFSTSGRGCPKEPVA